MSDSNRRKDLTLGLGVGILSGLFIGGFIYGKAETLDEQASQDAVDNAIQYAEAAEKEVAIKCVDLSPPEEIECVSNEVDAAREQQRQEYDLQAQKTMAAWTRAMGEAALVAMIVGLFGLGLLYVTFRETRRGASAGSTANEIARETAQRQLRPYVHVAEILPKDGTELDDKIVVQFKNFGQTPAERPTIRFGVMVKGESDNWPIIKTTMHLDRDLAPGHTQRSHINVSSEWADMVKAGKGSLRAVIFFEYSGFGIDGRETLEAKFEYTKLGPLVSLRQE